MIGIALICSLISLISFDGWSSLLNSIWDLVPVILARDFKLLMGRWTASLDMLPFDFYQLVRDPPFVFVFRLLSLAVWERGGSLKDCASVWPNLSLEVIAEWLARLWCLWLLIVFCSMCSEVWKPMLVPGLILEVQFPPKRDIVGPISEGGLGGMETWDPDFLKNHPDPFLSRLLICSDYNFLYIFLGSKDFTPMSPFSLMGLMLIPE